MHDQSTINSVSMQLDTFSDKCTSTTTNTDMLNAPNIPESRFHEHFLILTKTTGKLYNLIKVIMHQTTAGIYICMCVRAHICATKSLTPPYLLLLG